MTKYNGWTKQQFIEEYAASIDRMMTQKERTYTTVGGETKTYWAGESKLDLPEEFFREWHKAKV